MAYITIDDVKHYLVNSSDQFSLTDFDESLLNSLMDSICSFVELEIGNPVEPKQFDEHLTVSGSNKVLLSHFPVVSVNTVEVAFDSTYNFSPLDVNDFFLLKDSGILIYKKGSLETTDFGFHVVYTAGYETVPNDLKYLACELVYLTYQKIRHGTLDLSYMSNFRENVAFIRDRILLPHHERILETYRTRIS